VTDEIADTEKPELSVKTLSNYEIVISVEDNYAVNGYQVTTSSAEPDDWIEVKEGIYEFKEAGEYYVWASDTYGNTGYEKITVYSVTTTAGTGTNLAVDSNVVIANTEVTITAALEDYYEDLVVKVNDEETSKNKIAITEDTAITSSATPTSLLAYDEDGSLIVGSGYATEILSLENSDLDSEYTVYITAKGDTSQHCDRFPATLVAISESQKKYLTWFGYYINYFYIVSYRNDNPVHGQEAEKAFKTFGETNIADHSNKITNFQVTGVRGGKTKVYVNGELKLEFDSGDDSISHASISIGDLRVGRNLKFEGNIYDFAFYTKALTEDEITQNYKYANSLYNIE